MSSIRLCEVSFAYGSARTTLRALEPAVRGRVMQCVALLGLDLPAIERLERALVAYPGAIVLVSHDAEFATRCTNDELRL